MLTARRIRSSLRERYGVADDRGSLIVSLVVIMVVVAVVAAFATMVIGNQLITVNRQNTSSALATAEAGLSDALFRIDQYPPNTTGTTFCLTAITPAPTCALSSPQWPAGTSSSSLSYIATSVSATKWVIQSVGTVRGDRAAVQETLTRSPKYPFGLFANTSLNLQGTPNATFGTYLPGGMTNDQGAMAIGSNNNLVCDGSGTPSWVTPVIFTGGTVNNCTAPQTISTKYYPPTFPTTAPAGSYGCPNNGLLGTGNSYPTLGAAGQTTTFWCTQAVSISGNLAIAGTVNLYIILSSSVDASTLTDLSITAGSYVNFPPSGSPLPDATTFNVDSNGTGGFGGNSGLGYTLSGIIDAPYAQLTGNGCNSTYYGVLIINTLYCNGASSGFEIWYDSALNQYYGPWVTSGYKQTPPASVVIH